VGALLVDVRGIPAATRLAAADQIRTLTNFALPDLDWFNSAPCPRHATIDEGGVQFPPCRRCGVRLRKHQRVGVAWLYMRGHGLIADSTGTGKTSQAAGLLAVLKQTGELDQHRAVIIVRPAVLNQWVAELNRFVPRLQVATATGTRKQRIETYLAGWHVLITGFQMLVRDLDLMPHFAVGTLIVDDVDPLRNASNQTAYAIKRLARSCTRVAIFTATPLQKRLEELHSVFEAIGGSGLLGTVTAFRRRYLREELVRIYSPTAGRMVNMRKTVGYQHLDEFIAKIRPLTLRRTADDIDDVDLPVIAPPNNVYLDLYPAQRVRYDELRAGVLKIIKAEGTTVKRATAMSKFLYGAQICAGLATLGDPDGPGTSVKLDWVQRVLEGDLCDEKVVIFCGFTNTVAALAARLSTAGIGHAVFWGREQSKAVRSAAVERFWSDPTCRVLIGTSAIEQGLNLQVSRHLINVDQLMNPARMQQLAGRIKRDGSAHRTVYVHNLLTRGTQEEGYLELLGREQALADHVWGESNQLYEALSPLALLQLVGGVRPGTGVPRD
jgi:SNF2 family DNA or RNA helicase